MNKFLLSSFGLFACLFSAAQQSTSHSQIPSVNPLIASSMTPTVGGITGIILSAKVILTGPYDPVTMLMNDQLRVEGVIPLLEPYSSAPFYKPSIGGTSGETVTQDLLDISGSNAIVDWIFIELRAENDMNDFVATKRALLQRDGDVVSSIDGISPLEFDGIPSGNYYVSVKHRNHLGVMTLTPVPFLTGIETLVDFTTDPVWIRPGETNAPRNMIDNVWTLWAADANHNKAIKYNGLSNDKQEILNAIGSSTPNNILFPVYRSEDLNMDAAIKYNNANNDRNVVSNTVGPTALNNIVNQQTPN